MVYLTRKTCCPGCGRDDKTRFPRRSWMRYFKIEEHYRCRACRSHILMLRNPARVEPAPADEA